ncbi:MAG: hypothetical protein IPK74_36575 [Deltaproteobacteria bacterium]|nr:hypothetical protein [Deltaproteobacteria bacterium]
MAREAEAAKEYRVGSQALALAGGLVDARRSEPLLRRGVSMAVSGGDRSDMAIAWSLLATALAEF